MQHFCYSPARLRIVTGIIMIGVMIPFRHILITGASSGIGAALALHYARKFKDDLFLSIGGRSPARLENVARQCRQYGSQVKESLIEVTDAKAMSNWINETNAVRPLDLVIANAGISGGTGGKGYEAWDQARLIFDVNLYGVLNTIEPAAKLMTTMGCGQIAIMSSLAGYRGWPGAPAYCASKAAVKVYGEALRGSLAPVIKVNIICPGFIRSPMTDANDFPMPFLLAPEKAAQIIARGIEKNHGRISFPLPLAFLAWFFSCLPDNIASSLARKAPEKSALKKSY